MILSVQGREGEPLFNLETSVSSPTVITTSHRGMNAEEWAEAAVNRIVGVSMDAPMPIREQALAYKAGIKALLIDYFQKVAASERTTIKSKLQREGFAHVARVLEDI
jgi:hypothetical protein